MPVPSSSAQAALQGLVDQLRALRVEADMKAIELAAATGLHRTKISHIEHARRAPSVSEVRAWCRACGADEQADDIVATLRQIEGAYVQWKRLQQSGMRQLQESYMPLYERTKVRRVYSASVVPGLLQTPTYAAALMTQITEHAKTPDDVADAVEARMQRRQVLHRGGRFAFVLEEAVLTYGLGGPEVMVEQLRHLMADMKLPSVSVGIIPAGADRPHWPLETFVMFDETLVRVELLAARVSITAPGEIAEYASAFNRFTSMAVHGRHARGIIESALDRFDG